MNEPNANYDQPWKEIIGDYFEQFLLFFFPDVHVLIDWNIPPQSLEKELQQITLSSETALQIADKLFQVYLQDKREVWILIHIEVQSQEDINFKERMYIYNYRAFDLYKRPVISLAVLGDERSSWRPSSYYYTLGGCEVSLKFPITKLLDYEQQWDRLAENSNPFAVVVMAHLKTKATIGKSFEREQWKWTLVRGLYDRGYNKEQIIKLFQVIDKMMTLPKELQQSFDQKIIRFEEERKMPLLSNMEEKGIEQGSRQTAQDCLILVLQNRFTLSPELITKLKNISDVPVLKQLIQQAVTLNSLEEFEQYLNRLENI